MPKILCVAAMFAVVLFPESLCASETAGLNLIPLPKKIERKEGALKLSVEAKIAVEDDRLMPIAKILSQRLHLQTGVKLAVASESGSDGDILLAIDTKLPSEAYRVEVDEHVRLIGSDYRSVCWASATLSQLLNGDSEVAFPRVSITDQPDYEFRSMLLDLARRWHPVDTVKQTIDLLSLYKIKFLHLHLSDTQGCVYTSRVLPEMASGQAYSWEEMQAIVQYADQRGVSIIPEIDVPGHSSSWVRNMPEIFGTTDPATGEPQPLGIVNMANEKAYEALDRLVGELAEVFASSPYIHIGTDETGAGGLVKLPEYQPYCEKHGLTLAAKGQAHELFLHFIQRMSEIVKQNGKQPIAWNDFGGASTPNTQVPKDVLMTVWTGSPVTMAEHGYKIVNCCWVPLYMVPPQQRAPEANRIYDWNVRLYDNWHFEDPIVIPQQTPVEGAQLCFWEQRYNEVLPILQPRLPAFAERIWNENADRSFDDFKSRRAGTDRVVQQTILPVNIEAKGLIDPREPNFEEQLTVTLSSHVPGTIRYTLSDQWEQFPNAQSEVYSEPLKINSTTTVSAQLYDSNGEPVAGISQQRFRKMVPAYDYRILGPTPDNGWAEMPDFDSLEVLRTGVTGLMDEDRSKQINRAMFAQLPPQAHVDVRVHDVYNVKTIELTGQIRLPESGKYQFKIRTGEGMSALEIDDHPVAMASNAGREVITQGHLAEGTYDFRIKHFHYKTRNELNLWVKLPGATEFRPLEDFVLPISARIDSEDLRRVPGDAAFEDPIKAKFKNLATDKPTKSSGGWQDNWLPAKAVDGIPDNSSGWHADPYPQSLTVDLEKQHAVSRIKLYPFHDGHRYYQYTIEVSADGKTWEQVVDMTKNVQPSTKDGDEHNFDVVDLQFVRVNMLNNSVNSGVHINEIMVFEHEE